TAQERLVGGHHGVNLAHEVQVGFAFPVGDGEPDQPDAEGDHRAEGFSEGVNSAGHGGFIRMVCGGGCWRPTSLWAGRNARPPWSYSLSGAWVETSRCSPRGPAAESRALFVGFGFNEKRRARPCSGAFELALDPLGVAAAIEHGFYVGRIGVYVVVNREGENTAEQPVVTVDVSVNTSIERQ